MDKIIFYLFLMIFPLSVSAQNTLSGQVVNVAGTGLPGVILQITIPEKSPSITTTNDSGNFQITCSCLGEYEVKVKRAAGYLIPTDLTMTADTPITIRLTKGSVIAGRVTKNGIPLSDITVTATNGRQKLKSLTDDRGEYRIFGLPDGDYKVSAKSENRATIYAPGTTIPQQAQKITVTAVSEFSLDIAYTDVPAFVVSGEVNGTKQPVRVLLMDQHGQMIDSQVGAGFRFELPNGDYQLVAQARYETMTRITSPLPVRVTNAEQQIKIPILPAFWGKLIIMEADPAATCHVKWSDSPQLQIAKTLVEISGRSFSHSMSVGAYSWQLTSGTFKQQGIINITPDTMPVEIVLSPNPGSFSITDAASEKGLFCARILNGKIVWQDYAQPVQGTVSFQGLPAGEYAFSRQRILPGAKFKIVPLKPCGELKRSSTLMLDPN